MLMRVKASMAQYQSKKGPLARAVQDDVVPERCCDGGLADAVSESEVSKCAEKAKGLRHPSAALHSDDDNSDAGSDCRCHSPTYYCQRFKLS